MPQVELDDLLVRGDAMASLEDLLSDESRMAGTADRIAQPASEEELLAVVRHCAEEDLPLTVSAGLTGITGSGVPRGGALVNLKQMNRVLGLREAEGTFYVRCEPGVVLGDLRAALAKKTFEKSDAWDSEAKAALSAFGDAPEQFFPVDPTEWSACIGGIVACNASGARSFRYGAARGDVSALRGVLADGRIFTLRRGEIALGDGRTFALPLDNGETLSGSVPAYAMPKVKNAAGYYAEDNMDLLDLFVGSEGTLAVFSEIELQLVPAPEEVLGVICFAPDESAALAIVHALRGEGEAEMPARPLALEFFDHRALDLLRRHREEAEGSDEIPELPASFHTAVYVEFAGTPEEVEEATMALAELLEEKGVDEDATWMATEPREHERLTTFRHAIPETVNLHVGQLQRDCPSITKLGTDMAVPDAHQDEMLALYRKTLEEAALDYVIFGHIGDNHLHVNILPRTEEEYARGKEIYKTFAERAVAFGGTVSAEHGVGKLKTFLLPVLYGEDGVDEMRATKKIFDPRGRLNPGTLFSGDGE